MQLPSSNLIPDFLRRILRDGWTETTKDLPFPTVRYPRPKREPQKVELLVRVNLLPIGILAIDHFRLLRMQFQPTLLQPGVDTLILRELERGSFSVAREWTDWADPPLSDSLGFPPQRLDAQLLLELVTLLEVLTRSKQIG